MFHVLIILTSFLTLSFSQVTVAQSGAEDQLCEIDNWRWYASIA